MVDAVTDAVANAGFSRRKLLKGGVVSLVLLGLAGAGIALQRTKLRALPKDGLHVLTPEQYAVLCAIADRLCPRPAEGVPGATAIDVGLMADRLLEYAHDDIKQGIALALTMVESGLPGALFGERIAPFTTLSPEQQDAVLIAFRDSKVGLRRTIFRSFSSVVGSLYYGDPRTWPSVGYPGPPDPKDLRAAYAAQLVDLGALQKKS
jgi:hypothetical protein